MNLQSLLPIAIHAAEVAAQEILTVYNSADFEVEVKGDKSPLTIADKKAHQAIEKLLVPTGLPILSEEGKNIPYNERREWEYFWMVDPLDGTKEFIKRNGEFTVNIAVIHKGKPVLGVVSVPATGQLYFASRNEGAFVRRDAVTTPLAKRRPIDLTAQGLRIVASRSHMTDDTESFISSLKDPQLVSKGSSLKFMLLADGQADVYPRFAPTMEWDTAAAHAIVNEVGLKVFQKTDAGELVYNKENLLNPHFIVR